MADMMNFSADVKKHAAELKRMIDSDVPKFFAGAVERMKDANFSAQGFVINGSASPAWAKRTVETSRSSGKRILHSTGTLQDSVKVLARPGEVRSGVDLGKVPYAQLHNEGGTVQQIVKAHSRKHYRTGKVYEVKTFTRTVTMPKRQYLGWSPDIAKIAEKDMKAAIGKIFK